MTILYDKLADVLYISFADFAAQLSSTHVFEGMSGDPIKIDADTGRVLGCVVPFFLKRCAKGKLSIPDIGPAALNTLDSEADRVV